MLHQPRHPDELWRTAFYYDCRTARERELILRHGFRVDEFGHAPEFTRVVTGYAWFPIKLWVREVRGLPATDWETYRLNPPPSLSACWPGRRCSGAGAGEPTLKPILVC